jgi:dipeptidyl aminopeptidase/acylaminoacyl peptidase
MPTGAQQPAPDKDIALGQEAYLKPPKAIADAVLAPWHQNITLANLSPDGAKFLITRSDGLPALDRLARPCVHLAEMAFDPGANRAHQLYVRSNVGFDIFYHADKRKVPVKVPAQARVSNPVWSPDGTQLAFYAHFLDATHIYVADTATGQSRKLTETPVLATLVTSFQWSRDGKRIQTVLLPDDGTRVLKPNAMALEPKIRVALEGKYPSRTYRYLLESPYDMKLLEHLTTGQLAFIDVSTGKVAKVGLPSMFRSIGMGPAGEQFRVTTMKKPFSYYVPADRFGALEGIWNLEGKQLCTLADRELRMVEQPPPGTTPPVGKGTGKKGKGAQPPAPDDKGQPDGQPADADGKRDLGWRPDGHGMSFLQLEPASAADDKKPRKDRVLQWLPPFGKDDVKVVYETPQRILSLQYSDDCQMLFLTHLIDNQRQIIAVDLKDPKTTYIIHKSGTSAPADGDDHPEDAEVSPFTPPAEEFPAYGYDDEQPPKKGPKFGGGAGLATSLLTRSNRGEVKVVRLSSAGEVYVAGTDRTGGAVFPRAYIDRVHIKTGKKDRIFSGRPDLLETIDAVDSDDVKVVFTTRQKKDVVPDSYLNDLASGKAEKLTSNVDFTPWYHDLKVERFQVTRVDGFKFWVKVTTPAKRDGKLPAMFWIYPREYTDQAAYNRSTGGKDGADSGRFASPGVRSMALFTLLGYAVVEPDIPIVGLAGRINDNYVPDLRNGLWAVIDELDKRGIIDRDRLAVGGHSYGGFSTANALAHTPFFKAGIAGDGNYNRTLTPMTFQTEKRDLWEARATYLEMSPLLWANRVNGALLMYHGMEDANVGTNPINAEHLFMALRGLGKPAALYMYPYEGHGPIGRETILDQWARWTTWLDTYVKNPAKEKK